MSAMKRLVTILALSLLIWTQPAAAQSILRDAETEALFNDMSRPLILAAGLSPNNVRVVLINDNSINAFTAGGQTVYVNSGLIHAADNANQVQGVIAHELGHVADGHVILLLLVPSLSYVLLYRTYPRLVGETGGEDFILAHPSADPDVLRTALIRGAFSCRAEVLSRLARLRAAGVPRLRRLALRARLVRVRVVDGRAWTRTEPPSLAGGTSHAAELVRRCVLEVGIDPVAAVAAATSTPSALLGLDDRGNLATGLRADLVVLDHDWQVRRVMRGGDWVG